MNDIINEKIINYLKKYNPSKIALFGSYARNEDNENSDIDILIDFNGKISLFDLGGIKYDLTEILNRPVDILTNNSINVKIKDNVFKDLKIIYG